MDQQYYSSDEEIAWGPLTLREIKKELSRQKRPEQIKRRQTERYTKPSLYDFLQNEREHTNMNTRNTSYIANTNLTLVENTIVLSSDDDESIIEINSSKSSNECEHDDQIFTKNSEESSDLKELIMDRNLNVKSENLNFSKDSIDLQDSHQLNCTSESKNNFNISTAEESKSECDSNELECTLDAVNRILEGRLNISNEDTSVDDFKDTANVSLNVSPAEKSVLLPDDELDCTLDVVNKILEGRFSNFDQDESPNDFEPTVHNTAPQKSALASERQFLSPINKEEFKTPQALQKLPRGNKQLYKNIISPVAHYIKNGPSNTRIPVLKNTPAKNTGKVSPKFGNNYQNIISPVAHYIKSGPLVPLIQNVPAKTVTNNMFCGRISPKPTPNVNDNKNDGEFIEFPKVFYKPAKKTVTSKNEKMHLPGNIQKLLPQKITVTKHEGRLYNTPATIDSSVDLSVLDNTRDDDISIVAVKKTY